MTGDLCVLADVKGWLNIATGDTSTDAMLTRLISSCSNIITAWLGRDIVQTTYTETYNGSGTSRLILNQFPVTAVTSLSIGGVVIPASTGPTVYGYTFDESGLYLINGNFPQVNWLTTFNNVFGMRSQNVAVVYEAGYAAVPEALNQACIDFVAYKYVERGRIGYKSQNISVTGQGSSYLTDGLPDMVKAAIQPFRRLAPLM